MSEEVREPLIPLEMGDGDRDEEGPLNQGVNEAQRQEEIIERARNN
jgi:hypothetical protein